MNPRLIFAIVGILALLAGTALYLGTPRTPAGPVPVVSDAAPGAIVATRFSDRQGQAHTLGEFQGRVVVLNFWATWCAPCREEMPGFSRLQERWKDRGVRFVGVSDEERAKVDRFAGGMQIAYPLWTGDAEVMELSRRLGNRLGVLPHTVLLDGDGRVLESRIGIYPEKLLEERLAAIVGKSR
ncbi:Thiol-disulfide oxidoreductase ResA [Usitatibacter rugosus]|uniref:Thiol-disulfide oxidoreductase ResA n=1 Tax=Usitatibacter rugosus TaxID=2732067 RepID=A0A6M4H1A3_9PROT|nr:TlpA disulfide reductase family protein [Usitatibacter rugosus]QJR13125.1 Thiol-disulfide oxidoreductase ResA [Usitatibacter rugosus]